MFGETPLRATTDVAVSLNGAQLIQINVSLFWHTSVNGMQVTRCTTNRVSAVRGRS